LKQYVEAARGEPARRRLVAAANPRLQQKRSWIMRVKPLTVSLTSVERLCYVGKIPNLYANLGEFMQVKINGKSEEVPGGTVLDLLNSKKIEPQMVAVEVNDKVLDRNHLATTVLHDGDQVEFLFYMGGGR
jgi:sulfur carrier protein